MKEYRAWQTGKSSTPEEISLAVQNFIDKFGFPPSVLEVSDRLETVEMPEGLQIVKNVVRIPKNIMLVGTEETE